MPRPPWNDVYLSGELPWDTGEPDPLLVDFVASKRIAPGRALDVGCGTGTNAAYLAAHGFDVLGVDLAPRAVDKARERVAGTGLRCRFEAADFLAAPPAAGAFELVFDRGCFHVFDDAAERAKFARHVAAALVPGGVWLSLMGSTEGPPRDAGPPRRTAREIVDAIEPALELVELRADVFITKSDRVSAWYCLSRKRTIPAVPSSRRD